MTARHKKKTSKKKITLVLGFALSITFLIAYVGSSILYISNNTDALQTVFTEESYYSTDQDITEEKDLKLLSKSEAISVLSLTENQLLYHIDSQISDSIENAGIEINQELKKANLETEQTKNEENASQKTEDPAPEEEASFPGVNSVEAGIIHLLSNIRASQGLQALIPNPVLNAIARSRSQDMVNRGYLSHYTPEGKNIGMIMQENGIMYACCAENLGHATPPSWGSPETIVNLWMRSGPHRANIFNPHFGQLGIGVVDGNGRRVVTLILINR